jgi:hypothetical protein
MRLVILSYVASLAPPHFSTLSHIRHDFRGKKLLNIKRVVSFSLQFLSGTFLTIRSNQQHIINVQTYACKVPITLVRF